jgi:hypothetical protein
MSRPASFRLDCLLSGLFYLGLAITGALGFLLIRPELFAAGDATRTAANLVEREGLARIGIALELGIVTFQALTAIWFARLFREVDAFAAGALALLGMVNAIVVLASAAAMGTALDVARGSSGTDANRVQLMYLLSTRFWFCGQIFFGLWLVPMGWLVWGANFGPRILGWILVLGGAGYVLTPFLAMFFPDGGLWLGSLTFLATIGEFWMIGLLLWKGFRRRDT